MNPLLQPADTTYGIPDFDAIKPEHFEPAFDQAFRNQLNLVNKICGDPEPPSFGNTIEALERSGRLLRDVSGVFYNLTASCSNERLRLLESRIAPKQARHENAIYSNTTLFSRVDSISGASLAQDQQALLAKIHRRFVRNGVALPDADRARVSEIDGELASLKTQFSQNILQATREAGLTLKDPASLNGLPDDALAAAKEEALIRGIADAYVFTVSRASFTPFMKYADDRVLREQMYRTYTGICRGGDTDNTPIARRIAALRAERAKLLGYRCHADFALEDRMAGTVENVYQLLDQLWAATAVKVREDREELQAIARQEGMDDGLKPWDWWYLAEKLRAQKLAIDTDELKAYFELGQVRDGAFEVAHKLYGISFDLLPDAPRHHPDVEVYRVSQRDGSFLGIFMVDYFARPSKRGGAWMSQFRNQRRLDGPVRPIVVNTCNFSKGNPSLVSMDEVRTLFHEFGHGLHGLLTETHYESLSGTSVKQDFVELPSQIMEHWATEPEVLSHYARHFQTGDAITEELIAKVHMSAAFNQGFSTTEYLAACYLDLAWHTLKEGGDVTVADVEQHAMKKLGLIDEIAPRFYSTFFRHIFTGDAYAAGYYVYIWAAVLDTDAFELFKERGIFDQDTADAFRRGILARGGEADPMDLYRTFRGRDPEVAALLRSRNL